MRKGVIYVKFEGKIFYRGAMHRVSIRSGGLVQVET